MFTLNEYLKESEQLKKLKKKAATGVRQSSRDLGDTNADVISAVAASLSDTVRVLKSGNVPLALTSLRSLIRMLKKYEKRS